MKVFLSWSGDVSKQVAERLHKWLPDVLSEVDPWISVHDIKAGSHWGSDLQKELSESNFGILCLTPDNLRSPWLLFEAGAISRYLGNARLVPYRFGLGAAAVAAPLSQFQSVDANKAGTLELIRSLNNSRDRPIEASRLERHFAKWWPDLAKHLNRIARLDATIPARTDREILAITRSRISPAISAFA